MLKQTKLLKAYLNTNQYHDSTIIRAYASAIAKLGTLEDIKVLLDLFLQKPNAYSHTSLLYVIQKRGNVEMAEALVQNCFDDDGLMKEDINSDVFDCLVWLEHPKTKEILIRNLLNPNLDHSGHCSVCTGLLHYDGSTHQELFIKEVEACIGKNFFDGEFVPALVSKIHQPKRDELIGQLYESGSTVTSTDCNGGIVLGLALSEGRGEELFRKVLWDDHWEADDSSTGTGNWTYYGLQYLGITMCNLFDQIKESVDNEHVETPYIVHQLRMFKAMLSRKAYGAVSPFKFVAPDKETYQEIYQHIFAWDDPNTDNSVNSIASRFTQGKLSFYDEERLINRRMEEEILLMK